MNATPSRPQAQVHDAALSLTAAHSLRVETDGYGRLTTMLRAVRRLFAQNSHEEAQQSCEGILRLARELEQRAMERRQICEIRTAARGGDSSREADLESAYAELVNAQLGARSELVATLEVLADLKGHATAFRNMLMGGGAATYDRRGQTADLGGQGQ